ncbi:MAG: DNA repair protein RecN [Gemmatimonadota bacterium]
MLIELHIRDYAVVEELTLELGPGLSVLTGETGAGKSIIVGALSLVLGERASSSVVRVGAERASVEAVFDVSGSPDLLSRLDDLGYASGDGHLILRREVAAEGRNRAWVNSAPATAGLVGELGSSLVDLHGQHEHQTLLRGTEQRRILDAYAGAGEVAERVRRAHARVHDIVSELGAREARVREIEGQADFLRFQLGEIEAAKPHAGEDEELEAELRRREHAEDLAQGTTELHEKLYAADTSLADGISEARSTLARLVRFDPALDDVFPMLEDAYHAVSEAGRRLGDYATAVEHDPGRLEKVRRRLDVLFGLKRKYGPDLVDVLETAERVAKELRELEDADHDLEGVRRALGDARALLVDEGETLTAQRRDAADRLAEAVADVLPQVGLPGARFAIRLKELDEVGPAGAETVEFLVAPNPGFDPMALAHVASGGELSRVMLALKSILAAVDRVPVLVFDEIDAGIGGLVATVVAGKLSAVARRHQVLVVTHLPQIAARADRHLRVEKLQEEAITSARVTGLDGEARVEEVARMLGGDPESATSREHARELLNAGPTISGTD